jgi:hypothetical protein
MVRTSIPTPTCGTTPPLSLQELMARGFLGHDGERQSIDLKCYPVRRPRSADIGVAAGRWEELSSALQIGYPCI